MARLNPLDEDALLLDTQRRARERLGIRPETPAVHAIGNLAVATVHTLAARSPARARQQAIDFDAGAKLLERLRACRSGTLSFFVHELARHGDDGVTKSLDDLALEFRMSRRGAQKMIDRGVADGFLEVIDSGYKTPRRTRLVFALRVALSGANCSSPQSEAVRRTAVRLNKPLTSAPNSASINDSPNGTPIASRARHDDDQTCNGIISRSAAPAKRLSKRAARELLSDARIRADALRGAAMLTQAGIDTKEAERLGLLHESVQIGSAIARCRAEQARGRKFVKGFTHYVHGAVVRCFVRPEARELLQARGAGDTPPST